MVAGSRPSPCALCRSVWPRRPAPVSRYRPGVATEGRPGRHVTVSNSSVPAPRVAPAGCSCAVTHRVDMRRGPPAAGPALTGSGRGSTAKRSKRTAQRRDTAGSRPSTWSSSSREKDAHGERPVKRGGASEVTQDFLFPSARASLVEARGGDHLPQEAELLALVLHHRVQLGHHVALATWEGAWHLINRGRGI
ncbi:hypothetical protein EYF80_057726 [Liparis tanakae]|uniref:Uncharacterized protein n=1 Tax=Liparis tanakae TaxID=230148 RepID=A0A4Z2ETD6_9TELE|nr:hypothetical protein EYF80_057726 [Liparis tanakae]